jgi:N-dimethylarginine dimethylaminohydrolase
MAKIEGVDTWGRRYLMVRPDHFRIDYRINPYMDVASQPVTAVATRQWEHLVATLESLGATVDILDQRPDSPDMVYAMNLGLVLGDGVRHRVAMSHMRFDQRRLETESALAWFTRNGLEASFTGAGGVGAHFEAGDAFPFGGELVVGYGPRTDELALKHLAYDFDIAVRGVRIVHPAMYHLDLAFCPLDDRRALVCPAAFDRASADRLLAAIPEPILLSEDEALSTFCANSVVVGRTIVMPACPSRVRGLLEDAGFAVLVVDVSEFHKGGGSVRCLTNPLDIEIGRDLARVPGGELLPTA